MMSEIMEVPFPLASCKLLISFFTFQISTFLSEAVSSLILKRQYRSLLVNYFLRYVKADHFNAGFSSDIILILCQRNALCWIWYKKILSQQFIRKRITITRQFKWSRQIFLETIKGWKDRRIGKAFFLPIKLNWVPFWHLSNSPRHFWRFWEPRKSGRKMLHFLEDGSGSQGEPLPWRGVFRL